MKIKWKPLIISILIPLAVGGLSAFLTRDGMMAFESLEMPPLSPPRWLFPLAWTILYVLMGIASYLVFTSGKPYRSKTALTFYGIQLIFNFFWSLIFFNLNEFLIAFVWLVIMLFFIIVTSVLFYRISRPAGYLLIPYILWVTFAGYLNLGIYLLNR